LLPAVVAVEVPKAGTPTPVVAVVLAVIWPEL
jgi:hypothetical protein